MFPCALSVAGLARIGDTPAAFGDGTALAQLSIEQREALLLASSSCWRRVHRSWFGTGSGDSHGAGYLISPDLERPSAGKVMISGTGVGRTAEEVCNLVMNREKTLGLTG